MAKKSATVTAFKGFDKNLACRGFQFKVGETYTHDGPVERCSSGFHACENPLDVWGYYDILDSRFAIVEMDGELSREENGDSKIASGKITIKAELKLPEFINAAVKHVIDACAGKGDEPAKDYARIGSSGYSAQIGSSGDSAQIGSSGDSAQIGSSGYSARIGSSGDSAQIGSSGYSARIGSSGDYARIGSSGDSAQIKAEGANAVIACAGSVASFEVGPGGCIAAPWHDGKRTRFIIGYEGEGLKAGVRYVIENGEFVEASK